MSTVNPLDPSVRPGSLPTGQRGKHFGPLPIIIVVGVIAAILAGLLYGILARTKNPVAGDREQARETVPVDPRSMHDFLASQPDGEISARPVPRTVTLDMPPRQPLTPANVNTPRPSVYRSEPDSREKTDAERAWEEFQRKQIAAYVEALGSDTAAGDPSRLAALYDSRGVGQSVDFGSSAPMVPPDLSAMSMLGSLGSSLNAQAAQPGQPQTDPNRQADKLGFLNNQTDPSGYLERTRTDVLSKFELKTGTVIPGVMISGINSDLPGQIIAQISQHVYDTATGRHLLIPQGSKLYGTYDSQVTYGQERALVVWSRIIFPDASTLELEGMQGQDVAGYSGFNDRVDNHYLKTFGQLLLVSLFNALPAAVDQSKSHSSSTESFEIVTIEEEVVVGSHPDGTPIKETITRQVPVPVSSSESRSRGGSKAGETFRRELAQQTSRVGEELTRRNLGVQPTLTIRPGYRFNVMVNRDIAFETAYEDYR